MAADMNSHSCQGSSPTVCGGIGSCTRQAIKQQLEDAIDGKAMELFLSPSTAMFQRHNSGTHLRSNY